MELIEGEGNAIDGLSLLQWQGRNFIVYQDHTGNRGGNVKCVELDGQLHPVAALFGNRYRECDFYREGDTLYMCSSALESLRGILYATADAPADGDKRSLGIVLDHGVA